MRRPNKTLIALLLLAAPCRAQFLSFEKSYGGPNEESLGGMVQGTDGGFLMVGSTGSYGSFATDQNLNAYVVKTDEVGEVDWAFALGGNVSDRKSVV